MKPALGNLSEARKLCSVKLSTFNTILFPLLHSFVLRSFLLIRDLRSMYVSYFLWLLAVCLLFFSRNFSRDYEERLFSLKENGTRHGRGLLPHSATLGHTTLCRLVLFTANAVSVRDDLVTLREETGCQQSNISLVNMLQITSVCCYATSTTAYMQCRTGRNKIIALVNSRTRRVDPFHTYLLPSTSFPCSEMP